MSDTLFPVIPEIAAHAHVSKAQYEGFAAEAAADPQAFWAREGQRIAWMKQPTKILSGDFTGDVHASAVADCYLTSRAAALPTVAWAHGDDDVRGWVKSILIPQSEVIVAEQEGAAIGFVALGNGFVEQLYILPPFWRSGVGSQLLAYAKQRSPEGLKLYCFQQNLRARAFYEHHGFVPIT
eukprot:gene12792-12891_t